MSLDGDRQSECSSIGLAGGFLVHRRTPDPIADLARRQQQALGPLPIGRCLHRLGHFLLQNFLEVREPLADERQSVEASQLG
jgi:hypothetical protein